MKSEHPIRIANIIEEGRLGGPQLRAAMIASAFNQEIDTTIIFPKKNSKEFKLRCHALGAKYLLFPLTTLNRSWMAVLNYVILFPFEVLKLSRLLKKNSFDIVHVSGGSWQFKGILAAKLADIKIIWELNDTYVPFIIRVIFFFLSKLANGFIYGSERTKRYYKKFISTKQQCFLIQSPVDVNYFDPTIKYQPDKFIKKNFSKKKIVIGTVANVNPTKDFITFIKTAKKLSNHKNEIIFIVIGSIYKSQKKYYENLLKLIRQTGIRNVYFLNSRKDVRPLLKIIDIYLCSSKNESSPLSMWEAMSMEKAIVSTDVGDVKKFIINGTNGFLVKVGDADNLANRISELIKQPKLRNTFGKHVRKIAKKELDLRICMHLHVRMYKAINGYK